LLEFRKDFELGLIEINSIPLLKEMRAFSVEDSRRREDSGDDTSAHFDRVIAFAIAYQMRKYKKIKGFLNYNT